MSGVSRKGGVHQQGRIPSVETEEGLRPEIPQVGNFSDPLIREGRRRPEKRKGSRKMPIQSAGQATGDESTKNRQ